MPNGWAQQRGTRYRALYRFEGKVRTAGTFQYKFQAQAAAEAAEILARTGERVPVVGVDETILMAEYAARWLATRVAIRPQTRRSYAGSIANQIVPKLGNIPVANEYLTKMRVREWVVDMETDEKIGVATRNAALKTLRMICKMAVEEDDLLTKDPTRGIRRQKPLLKAPRAFLSDEQLEDILQAAETIDWLNTPSGGRRVILPPAGMFPLAILLGSDAGLRWEEISALDLASVKVAGNRMTLHIHRTCDRKGRVEYTTKNGEARDVPVVTERLRRALSLRMKQARLEHGGESLLIYRADGSTVRYEHWKRVLLAGAYQAAGVVAVGWHDLRHTYGSRLAEEGTPTKMIATLMGHNEEDVTQLYMHSSTADVLRAAVERALSR